MSDSPKDPTPPRRSGWAAGWREFWAARNWQPRPVGPGEWFCLRLGLALVVGWSFLDSDPFTLADQPRPTGVAHFVSLRFLHAPHAEWVVRILAAALLLVYVSGRGLLTSLLGLTVLSTMVRTYANSQGFINHSYQIVTLTLVAQTVTVALARWFERRKGWVPAGGLSLASYVLYYSQGVMAGAYVTSAIVKLINSRGLWVWNTIYLPLELVKSHREKYYSSLNPEFAGDVEHVAWMLAHPWVCRGLFGSGFFLELFALLALRGRPWALALGLGLIGMHQSIEYLMTLRFHFNVALLTVFFINLPGWVAWAWAARNSRLATGARPS